MWWWWLWGPPQPSSSVRTNVCRHRTGSYSPAELPHSTLVHTGRSDTNTVPSPLSKRSQAARAKGLCHTGRECASCVRWLGTDCSIWWTLLLLPLFHLPSLDVSCLLIFVFLFFALSQGAGPFNRPLPPPSPPSPTPVASRPDREPAEVGSHPPTLFLSNHLPAPLDRPYLHDHSRCSAVCRPTGQARRLDRRSTRYFPPINPRHGLSGWPVLDRFLHQQCIFLSCLSSSSDSLLALLILAQPASARSSATPRRTRNRRARKSQEMKRESTTDTTAF